MKKFTLLSFAVIFLSMLQGCEIIGNIFEAGLWVGIVIVVAVIALIVWLFGKARK